jgi:two-component system, response regulator PdtaR
MEPRAPSASAPPEGSPADPSRREPWNPVVIPGTGQGRPRDRVLRQPGRPDAGGGRRGLGRAPDTPGTTPLDGQGAPGAVGESQAAMEEAGAEAAPRRVLVVEDQAIIAMEIEDTLTDLGCDVVALAIDADEAVALADSLRPDLVTMDINLGRGRDGISAATEIFERFGIRSVFVSADGNGGVVVRAGAAQPVGWIPKPINASSLRAVLDSLPTRPRR